MKDKKEAIGYVLVAIIGAIIGAIIVYAMFVYAMFVFGHWEINPGNWGDRAREACVVFMLLGGGVGVLAIVADK